MIQLASAAIGKQIPFPLAQLFIYTPISEQDFTVQNVRRHQAICGANPKRSGRVSSVTGSLSGE